MVVDLPRRADAERVCDLCGLVGSTPKERSAIFEAVDKSRRTTQGDIQYAKALGLIKEAEDGIKATNRGIDISHTNPNEKRREKLFRDSIADFEPYSTLTSKLSSTREGEVFERRDVDRHIRISIDQDLKDGPRKNAATLYLQTLEAAGIGRYVRGRGENPARLEINQEEDLNDLLELISGRKSKENTKTTPEKQDREAKVERDAPPIEDGSPQTISSIASPVGESLLPSFHVTLDIQLELDGTEDPSHIQELVAGIREGLVSTESEGSMEQEVEISPENDYPESDMNSQMAENEPDSEQKTNKETDRGSPDSSLGDFE